MRTTSGASPIFFPACAAASDGVAAAPNEEEEDEDEDEDEEPCAPRRDDDVDLPADRGVSR